MLFASYFRLSDSPTWKCELSWIDDHDEKHLLHTFNNDSHKNHYAPQKSNDNWHRSMAHNLKMSLSLSSSQINDLKLHFGGITLALLCQSGMMRYWTSFDIDFLQQQDDHVGNSEYVYNLQIPKNSLSNKIIIYPSIRSYDKKLDLWLAEKQILQLSGENSRFPIERVCFSDHRKFLSLRLPHAEICTSIHEGPLAEHLFEHVCLMIDESKDQWVNYAEGLKPNAPQALRDLVIQSLGGFISASVREWILDLPEDVRDQVLRLPENDSHTASVAWWLHTLIRTRLEATGDIDKSIMDWLQFGYTAKI